MNAMSRMRKRLREISSNGIHGILGKSFTKEHQERESNEPLRAVVVALSNVQRQMQSICRTRVIQNGPQVAKSCRVNLPIVSGHMRTVVIRPKHAPIETSRINRIETNQARQMVPLNAWYRHANSIMQHGNV